MFSRLLPLLELSAVLGAAYALPSAPSYLSDIDAPIVQLDNAAVVGLTNNSVTSFTGIPFAHPPLGDLRLRLPKPIDSYNGTIDATPPAMACIQLNPPIRADLPSELGQAMQAYAGGFVAGDVPQGEDYAPYSLYHIMEKEALTADCLTINVQVPEGTQPGDKLPVIAFIFGGGFTIGSTSQMGGEEVVKRSVELNQPVIFAAINYRLHAFGFLGGKEVKEAGVGNLGLQDQREGLRWIKKHIEAFGGDPNKVTIWGPSSGAISSALQMVTNGGNTEGLFRGAVMSAGSPIPTGHIDEQQPYYDTIVEHAGCANATDTLECLRQVPAETLLNAAAVLPNLFEYPGLASVWAPRADGVFLKAPPQHLVLSGSVAKVPFITANIRAHGYTGDALDEGTVFASGSFNITTEAEFRDYVHEFYFSHAPRDALSPLFALYPNDPAQGSPFGTGDANRLAPMYKRMSAFQGDVIFQAPRRFFLDNRAAKQPTWSFISARGSLGGLGVAHGSDVGPALFIGDELTDYIIQFTATLDPNGGASDRTIEWPKYDTQSRTVLSLVDSGLEIGNDTARLEAMAVLSALSVAYPL
ncbi:carotenoid ester lipase precursor [Fomes fomentarius]|nr:carotenoid ester lipase precursor [Fomes fomentarius]